jgi:hypothetical protein
MNPRWQGGEVEKQCEICGESFSVKQAKASIGFAPTIVWAPPVKRRCPGRVTRTGLQGLPATIDRTVTSNVKNDYGAMIMHALSVGSPGRSITESSAKISSFITSSHAVNS